MSRNKKRIVRTFSVFLSLIIIVYSVSACSLGSFLKKNGTGFVEGWKAVDEYLGTKITEKVDDDYLNQVAQYMGVAEQSDDKDKNSSLSIEEKALYAEERWTSSNDNIDSLADSSLYSSTRLVNKLFESKKNANYVTDETHNRYICENYYDSSSDVATEQAIVILESYRNHINESKTDKNIGFQQFCEEYGYNSEIQYLYNVNSDSARVIPEELFDDAVNFLKGKVDVLEDRCSEILVRLKIRLNNPDENQTIPFTVDELRAVAELAYEGDFVPEDFGLLKSQIVTPKYLIKQAINGGLSSETVEVALSVGPDLFSFIRWSLMNGKLNVKQLINDGIDGLFASSIGYIEGAVCNLILSKCIDGIFKDGLAGISPKALAAIARVTKEAISYGYALEKGDITPLEYGDLIAEVIIVESCKTAAGVALESILPAMPMAYTIGSFVGGMLAKTGYDIVKGAIKQIVGFFAGLGGFECFVCDDERDDLYAISNENIMEASIFFELSSAKDLSINLDGEGKINIGLDGEFYCTNCGALLNDMEGFDPQEGYFYCEDCGMLLYDGNTVYSGERYPDVIWFCDKCGDCLSKQEGFSDLNDEWICKKCFHINAISEDEILET
ncbi:MAG: hypothetical protein J5379_05770 [Clostridiales bacterium]|nr:hypothetical protein [Clostridiales bacterium]